MFSYFIIIAVAVLIYTSLWYIYGQKIGRLDVADEAWGLAQPFIVLIAIFLTGNYYFGSIILFILTFIWGYRLASHIHQRHNKSSFEDVRYTEMRSGWKTFPKLKAYIYVFLLQGFLMYLLGISSIFLIISDRNWNYVSLVGVVIWLFGFIFESIADNQLKGFIAKPENKGKIMDQGLWKYSRHPNYFGEVTMWWGIFIFVFLNINNYWAIITPITITILIVFVSGIPLTEKHFESKPNWQEYKKRTSALIPLPNRK